MNRKAVQGRLPIARADIVLLAAPVLVFKASFASFLCCPSPEALSHQPKVTQGKRCAKTMPQRVIASQDEAQSCQASIRCYRCTLR